MTNNTKTPPSFTDKSHPESRGQQADAAEGELCRVAHQINSIRNARRNRPSDRAFVREWPGLGSAKTWAKIIREDTGGMNCAKHLVAYRGVLSALQADIVKRGEEELYEDLSAAEAASLAVLRLLHHHGKNRFIHIEGGTGAGKTSLLKIVKRGVAAGSIVSMDASIAWKSTGAAMDYMLKALGEGSDKSPLPHGIAAKLDKLIEVLQRRGRVILWIDEAHHLTASVINLIITLLNQTSCSFVLAGIHTLFAKLKALAAEEANQLFKNRMFVHIRLSTPSVDDTLKFLARRLNCEPHWKNATVDQIRSLCTHGGLMACLRNAVDSLLEDGFEGSQVDDATLLSAVTAAAEVTQNAA